MSLVGLLIALVVIGVILYVLTTYLPMPAVIKNLIIGVGVIVALLLVLQAFGVIGSLGSIRVR